MDNQERGVSKQSSDHFSVNSKHVFEKQQKCSRLEVPMSIECEKPLSDLTHERSNIRAAIRSLLPSKRKPLIDLTKEKGDENGGKLGSDNLLLSLTR